jgi:aspartate ammonia-lyase
MNDLARLSGEIRNLALELTRISNDLRLLASGPRTGLGEIQLPPVQPGSSIMPGKVNPVMFEMLNQVCFQVLGQDAAVSYMVQAGQMELNVMMPALGSALFDAMDWLQRDERRHRENLGHRRQLRTPLPSTERRAHPAEHPITHQAPKSPRSRRSPVARCATSSPSAA